MTTLDKLKADYHIACVELAEANAAVHRAATEDEKVRLAGVWFTIAVRRSRLFDAIVKLNTESNS